MIKPIRKSIETTMDFAIIWACLEKPDHTQLILEYDIFPFLGVSQHAKAPLIKNPAN